MLNESTSPMFFALALTCAGIGCYHDLRERRIPNLLTGPAILLAFGLHLVYGGWTGLGSATCAALLAGAATVLFFLAGGMGAGDVKLMTAVGAFLGLETLPHLLLAVAICGGILATAIALRHRRLRRTIAAAFTLLRHHRSRGLVPHPEHHLHAAEALRMPFALPIAAGCLVAAVTHSWSV